MTWSKARDIVWTALGVAGLLYVAGSVLHLVANGVLLLALGALLAFILAPPVSWLQRCTGLGRGPAASITYGIMLIGLGSLGSWAVAALSVQAAGLASTLPAALQDVQQRIPALEQEVGAFGVSVDLRQAQTDAVTSLQRTGIASQGIAWAGALGVSAINAFLVLVLSFYLVVDGARLGEMLVAIAPARAKPYLLFAEKSLLQVVGGYLRGQLMMGAIVAGAVLLLCLALGIRYSVVLAAMAFFSELMPMIGPVMMASSIGAVGFLDSLRLALIAVGTYFALRTAAVYILGPRIIHRTVGLHPIATTLGLALGAKLFGVWGVVFAAPVLGFVFVVAAAVFGEVQSYRRETREARDPRDDQSIREPRRSDDTADRGSLPRAA